MKIISWLGTVLGILGASLLSFNISFSKYGYILFFLSSVMWIIVAYKKNDNALLTLNIFFFLINSIGIYRWIVIG